MGLIKKITVKDAWVNSVATGLPQWQLTSIKFQLNAVTLEGFFSISAFKKIAQSYLEISFKILGMVIQHKIRLGKLRPEQGFAVLPSSGDPAMSARGHP